MNKSYHDLRSEYLHAELDESDVSNNPFGQFGQWMDEAIKAKVLHPTAMMLATAGKDGQPSARIVLLKNANEKGFTFFTNYDSHKSCQMAENPQAVISFFWMAVERQIRIEGRVEKVGRDESEEYFHSRPYESKLSAIVSPQSKTVQSRHQLETAKQKLKDEYADQELGCPENWGGFVLVPDYFEFWQGRESRLHDRITYTRTNTVWEIRRIAP